MIHCPKCGSYATSGPSYDAQTDTLGYWCLKCGYHETRLPRDRAEDARRLSPDAIRKALGRS